MIPPFTTLSFPLLLAFAASLVLSGTVRRLARRWAFTDHTRHRAHAEPKPLGGGIAVLASIVITVAVVYLVAIAMQNPSPFNTGDLFPLLMSALVVCAIGLCDDYFALRIRQKLVGQLLAISVVIAAGLTIQHLQILHWRIELGLLAIPFTALWLLGTINAVNLLDGSDGCASTVGIVVAATLGVIAALMGDWQAAIVAAAMVGALLGFLVFNFPPSSIRLGDAGSLTIGMLLGVLSIQGHLKGPATVVLATPLALLAIPILDTSAALLRRWSMGRRILVRDHAHLHHVLRRRGFSPRQIVACVFLLSCVTAAGALASVVYVSQIYALASIVLLIAIMWANDLFGNRELQLLGMHVRRLVGSLIPKRLRAVTPHQSRIGLNDSRACRHLWTDLTSFAQQHDLSHVRLDLSHVGVGGDTVFWERRHESESADNWQTKIPLAVDDVAVGQLEMGGTVSNGQGHKLLVPLSDLIDSLEPDLEQLLRECELRTGQLAELDGVGSRDILTFDRADIVGVKFDFLPGAEVLTAIEYWRRRGQRSYITLTNPHSVMLCRRDQAMRNATVRADLTLPDGVGVLLAAKLLGYGRRHRVSGPSLMLILCDAGRQAGYRHFFYGGAEGVADQLAQSMREKFPGLEVAGTYCPPFGTPTREEDEQAVEAINASRPDIIWVGLGAPKQEKWMADHAMCIDATAMIGVGAAFDFHTGNVMWAPWIVRKCGMEWAYRLALEPRRLWRRNLDSPLFLFYVSLQLVKRLVRNILGGSAAPRVRSVTWCSDAGSVEQPAIMNLKLQTTNEE